MKKLWNMKVTVIPIVAGALGTVPNNLAKIILTIWTTAQLKSGYLEESLRSKET